MNLVEVRALDDGEIKYDLVFTLVSRSEVRLV